MSRVIKNYAESLFGFCKDSKCVMDALEKTNEFVEKNKHFTKKATPQKCKILVAEQIKNQISIENSSLKSVYDRFISLLLAHNRLSCFPKIYENYLMLYNKYKNIKNITATVAQKNDEYTNSIIQTLEKKLKCTVMADIKVDPEILGGVIIEFDDYIMDASIKSKIQRISQKAKSIEIA